MGASWNVWLAKVRTLLKIAVTINCSTDSKSIESDLGGTMREYVIWKC